jgi:6-hydroxy-3-succinoylpyridine 3-monooxygenase
MKTVVYVDGFNLYYGLLRGTPFKWLDPYGLFQDHVLDAATRVEKVRYYTAPIKGSASDDPASPRRQQLYLRALKAYLGDRIEIVHGSIVRTTPILRLVNVPQDSSVSKVRVVQLTERQTDVNLAADLISDACLGRCEQAVVCSNDRDLAGAFAAVRRDHPGVSIGLVAPVRDQRYVSSYLSKLANWYKPLSMVHIARAQLPDKIPGTPLSCPDAWRRHAAPVAERVVAAAAITELDEL